jgi:hypothetical protein
VHTEQHSSARPIQAQAEACNCGRPIQSEPTSGKVPLRRSAPCPIDRHTQLAQLCATGHDAPTSLAYLVLCCTVRAVSTTTAPLQHQPDKALKCSYSLHRFTIRKGALAIPLLDGIISQVLLQQGEEVLVRPDHDTR